MALERIPLPAARKLKNLTQQNLADGCGVSVATVYNWEKYITEPSVTQALKIAEMCGLSIDDIIFLPPNTAKP